MKQRLRALEKLSAKQGRVLTEAQVQALERKKQDDEACGEIETQHPYYRQSGHVLCWHNQRKDSYANPFNLNNEDYQIVKMSPDGGAHKMFARNLILSAIMKTTAKALALIRDGVLERIMALLHAQLGKHSKR